MSTPVSGTHDLARALQRAAGMIGQADGLLITAGAGMGVDSGLPDFRGTEGFWQAYPALGQARIRFESIANPQAFRDAPRLAWGFYGHRLALYRATRPHAGFDILRRLGGSMPQGSFVFTSNVDGQFQAAGFADDTICEVHGSIHHLQCAEACCDDIWSANDFAPEVDTEHCLLTNTLPTCPRCGGLARPNILMFNDWHWLETRHAAQHRAMQRWLRRTSHPVVIELGAGTAIPTVRMAGEALDAPLIRVNLRESQVARRSDLGLSIGALAALQGILAAME